MTEPMKSSRLYNGPKLIPVAKFAPEYSEEQRVHFREAFRSRAECYRRYSRCSLAIGFVAFIVWIASLEILPKLGLQWVCFALFAGLFGLHIYGWYKRPLLECPACHNPLDSQQLGTYCPECGSGQLKPGSWLLSPSCNACGQTMRRGKGRGYKIRACTHCGVFLDDKGL